MNSLQTLAVIIYDDFFGHDKKLFIDNLINSVELYEIKFYYFGKLEMLVNYEISFEEVFSLLNLKDSIINFLSKKSFDYYLFITPQIILKKPIILNNYNKNKINYFNKHEFLILFSNHCLHHFIFYLFNKKIINYFDFNDIVPGNYFSVISELQYSTHNKYQNEYYSKIKNLEHKNNLKTIGLVFTGISHDITGKFVSGYNSKVRRSFMDCYHNHFEKIINPLSNYYKTRIYLTTYSTELDYKLIEAYQPYKCFYVKNYNNNMQQTYSESMQNLVTHATDVDFFITTRFDIKFYDKISVWNFNYDKFNFLFQENWGGQHLEVCDAVFAFPKEYLQPFCLALEEALADKNPRRPDCTGEMHYIYDYVVKHVGEKNIHFVSEEMQSTANADHFEQTQNRFFYLCRTPL